MSMRNRVEEVIIALMKDVENTPKTREDLIALYGLEFVSKPNVNVPIILTLYQNDIARYKLGQLILRTALKRTNHTKLLLKYKQQYIELISNKMTILKSMGKCIFIVGSTYDTDVSICHSEDKYADLERTLHEELLFLISIMTSHPNL